VTILDVSVGNLHSIRKALERVGADPETLDPTPHAVDEAEALLLPGVGAFGAAVDALGEARDALRDAADEDRPILGICLGMQILFDESQESPGDGLGILPGPVTRLPHKRLPQVGWNRIETRDDPLTDDLPPDPHVYYVNGYAPEPEDPDDVAATSPYGRDFAALVRRGPVAGTQFHPEKSSLVGLRILRNWTDLAEAAT
jgi:glutamine amidotransferase